MVSKYLEKAGCQGGVLKGSSLIAWLWKVGCSLWRWYFRFIHFTTADLNHRNERLHSYFYTLLVFYFFCCLCLLHDLFPTEKTIIRTTAGKGFQWQISLWLLLFLTPALSFSSDSISQSADNIDIDIYVNSSVPDQQYSLSEVRAIFTMRKTIWPDGTKIKVFVLPDDDSEHRLFTKSRLHMFPHQFRRIWDRLTFSVSAK